MNGPSRRLLGILLAALTLALSACRAAGPAPTAIPVQAMAAELPTEAPSPAPTVDPRVLWVTATGGAVWGTPTVTGGVVYVGSDDGKLYALDEPSGKVRWRFETGGRVRSCPAVDGDLVYIASDDGYACAVHAGDGTQAWRTDIGNTTPLDVRADLLESPSPRGYDYRQSSPVVALKRVYVGSRDHNIYALDAATGAVIWKHTTGDQVRATPTVADGVVYVGSWDETMYALDAQNGEVLWQRPLGGEVQSTALVADGLVYCASRKASVVALDASTGELRWERSYGTNMWVESSPRLVGDTIYIGSSASRIVLALDRVTGEDLAVCGLGACAWSTPAVAGDTLYIGGTDTGERAFAGLFALPLVDGKLDEDAPPRWLVRVRGTLDPSGRWCGVGSSPVLADGAVFFGGLNGNVYAVRQ